MELFIILLSYRATQGAGDGMSQVMWNGRISYEASTQLPANAIMVLIMAL